MATCEYHSGFETEIRNLKDNQTNDRNANSKEHDDMWTAINGLRNRLPIWATFLIGGMGTVIGYLWKH